jgi:hypothetical protein
LLTAALYYNTDDCQAAQYPAIYETHSCPNLPTLSYLHFFRLAAASSLYLARGAYSLFSSNPINYYNVPSDRSDRAVAPHVQYYTPNVDGRIGRPGHFLSMLTGGEFPTSPLKFPTSPCPFPTSDFAVFIPNFCYYSLFIRPSDRQ